MSLDLNQLGASIGAIVVGLGTIVGGGYAWWLKQTKAKAVTRADVAEADASRKVADAEGTVYALMERRLAALEAEMGTVRAELQAERNHSHQLQRQANRMELHIMRLEHQMKQAGLEFPAFVAEPGAQV